MSFQSPILIAREHFGYLFDHYGFEIIYTKEFGSFGNWVIVMQLDRNCRIRIFHDRGEIIISFGPAWTNPDWEAGSWYDIAVVLMDLDEVNDHLLEILNNPKSQLEMVSEVIRPLIPKIFMLFNDENYDKEKHRLDRIRSQIEDETWKKLIRKD